MPKRYLQRPAILVDHKKFRVRIYRYTLHLLGNPEHIVVIVNPYNQSITIMRSEQTDQRAYCIGQMLRNTDKLLEIFSTSLIRDLFAINERWNQNQSYRVYGEASSDGNAVIFNLADSEVFLGERGWQL